MKIHAGLWYLCRRTLRHWSKDYWYYSPADGRLKGDDNQPHEISDYIATRYFGDGMEMQIAEPKTSDFLETTN